MKDFRGYGDLRKIGQLRGRLMLKFIKLTDYGSGVEMWVNPANLFSMHRQPGTECTVLKSLSTFEQVREAPDDILKMIAARG